MSDTTLDPIRARLAECPSCARSMPAEWKYRYADNYQRDLTAVFAAHGDLEKRVEDLERQIARTTELQPPATHDGRHGKMWWVQGDGADWHFCCTGPHIHHNAMWTYAPKVKVKP